MIASQEPISNSSGIQSSRLSPGTSIITMASSSSFQNIIPELLSEIFMYCVLEDANEDHLWPLTDVAPLKLGRVCSYWRTVSLSHPKLWTIINLAFENEPPGLGLTFTPEDNESQLAEAAQIFMDRARNHSVSYTLVSDGVYLNEIPSIGEQLQRNVDRLKELHLDIPLDLASLIPWLPDLFDEAPTLQSLVLHCGSNIENQVCEIGSMPCLSRLELMGDPTTFMLREPLPQLRQLVLIHYACTEEAIEWLKLCPALEILFISFASTLWGEPQDLGDLDAPDYTPCELRSLSKMTLECEEDQNFLTMQAFLNQLTAPSLEDLSLASQSSPAQHPLFEEYARPLQRFLDRSSPRLLTLSISVPWMDAFVQLDILNKTHSIRSLDLTKQDSHDVSNVLECMTNPAWQDGIERNGFCPELQRLTVSQDPGTLHALRAMVSSRCNERSNNLRELTVLVRSNGRETPVLGPDPIIQNDPALLECIRHGLEMKVRTYSY